MSPKLLTLSSCLLFLMACASSPSTHAPCESAVAPPGPQPRAARQAPTAAAPSTDSSARTPGAAVSIIPFNGDPAAAPAAPPNPYDVPLELSLDALSGAEIALMLADHLAPDSLATETPTGDGLPRPRSASDNNPFALVRASGDLAHDGTPIVVSHDGKAMAFIPSVVGQHRVLWVANIDGSNARQVVDLANSRATTLEGTTDLIASDALFSPSFSADGRLLYFQTDGWATSLALYSVNLRTGAIAFVTDANGYEVISECRDASLVGSLVTYRHSYSEMPLSAVDWYFLHDKNGKRRGVIGPTEENVERFLTNRCGAPPSVPAYLKQRPGCDGFVLLYRPKRLLDGTELPVFFSVAKEDATRPFESLDIEQQGMALYLEDAKELLRERCAIE